MKKGLTRFRLEQELLIGCEFYDNITQVYIRTTEDKLRNILRDFKEAYTTKYSWTTPLALLLSFLATVLTATFGEKFGCSKEFWEAFFYFLILGSVIWLVVAVGKALKSKGETNIQNTIDKIKNSIV